MPDTPSAKYAIERPADVDFIETWPAIMRAALDWLDANIATAITDDPRPAAGKTGRLHRAADGTLSFDTGAQWVGLSKDPHAARHAAGGPDPLVVNLAMLNSDVPLPPVGAQLPFAGVMLPGNGKWAFCDGSLVDRTVYSDFYSLVGHAYNGFVDPGGNLVRLPDKRGRSPIGATTFGQGFSGGSPGRAQFSRGGNGGESIHLLTESESGQRTVQTNTDSPDHWHPMFGVVALPGVVGAAGAQYVVGGGTLDGTMNASNRHNHAISGFGAAAYHNNLHPVEADYWIVRII